MSLVYSHVTGSVITLPDLAAKAFVATNGLGGWHGPFETDADLKAFYEANKTAHPDWKKPESLIDQVTPDFKPIDPLGFANINFQSWFLRIAEILIGTVLIGVGLAHLSDSNGNLAKVLKGMKK